MEEINSTKQKLLIKTCRGAIETKQILLTNKADALDAKMSEIEYIELLKQLKSDKLEETIRSRSVYDNTENEVEKIKSTFNIAVRNKEVLDILEGLQDEINSTYKELELSYKILKQLDIAEEQGQLLDEITPVDGKFDKNGNIIESDNISHIIYNIDTCDIYYMAENGVLKDFKNYMGDTICV